MHGRVGSKQRDLDSHPERGIPSCSRVPAAVTVSPSIRPACPQAVVRPSAHSASSQPSAGPRSVSPRHAPPRASAATAMCTAARDRNLERNLERNLAAPRGEASRGRSLERAPTKVGEGRSQRVYQLATPNPTAGLTAELGSLRIAARAMAVEAKAAGASAVDARTPTAPLPSAADPTLSGPADRLGPTKNPPKCLLKGVNAAAVCGPIPLVGPIPLRHPPRHPPRHPSPLLAPTLLLHT